MLALEFEQPSVFGAVHHLTVICYNIQHPDPFTDEALGWMRSMLRAVVEDDLSGPDLLKRARRTFKGDVRIKRHGVTARAFSRATDVVSRATDVVSRATDVAVSRARWSMTVADVRAACSEVYTEDIKAWAKSILNDLAVK